MECYLNFRKCFWNYICLIRIKYYHKFDELLSKFDEMLSKFDEM